MQVLFVAIALGSTAVGTLDYPIANPVIVFLITSLFLALLWQRYAVEPFLPLVAVLLVALAFTDFALTAVTFGTVMREVFVISAYHRRPLPWLATATVGSITVLGYQCWLLNKLGTFENGLWYYPFAGFTVFVLLSIGLFTSLGLMRGQERKRGILLQERAALLEERTSLLEERAAFLEEQAQLAAITERTRIAREMHDIVAHSLTGIIAQADGGRFAGKQDPQQALAALDTISQSGRTALQEMRGLLSVLRDGEQRSWGTAGLADVPQLLQEATLLGLQVQFQQEGTPGELSALAGSTVFRTVQEGLTNAAKHAGKVMVQVRFTWSDALLHIRVSNPVTSSGLIPTDPQHSSGQGLRGLAERVQAVGGSYRAQQVDTQFVLQVAIPRQTTPETTPETTTESVETND